ncbi:glycosyltransferase family 39 protein [Candidatus Woesearchaeota archaeon]|nr:glycosyltransferase family 39 protein [Candidatus Woesearchaeota archaeon]
MAKMFRRKRSGTHFDMGAHFDRYRIAYLVLIIVVAVLFRVKYIDLCDANDRAQVAMGMTNNLPPLYHYLSLPVYWVTGDLWFAPAIVNIILDVLVILLLYSMGVRLKGSSLGLVFSFLYAMYPLAIINARAISPETAETFSVIVILYIFIRGEFSGHSSRPRSGKSFSGNSSLWAALLFIAAAVGAFSKQQTLVVLVPMLLFLLWRYRFSVFCRHNFYALLFAPLPYLAFLLAHPEMLAAVVIYLNQAVVTVGFLTKIWNVLLSFILFGAPFLVLAGLYFIFRRYEGGKKVLRGWLFPFLVLFTIVIFLFLSRTLAYVHLLTLPVIVFSGIFIHSIRNDVWKYALLLLIFAYAFVGFYLSIPHVSINTNVRCEQDFIRANPVHLTALGMTEHDPIFFNRYGHFEELFEGEKYIIIGGNIGQDLKYNIYRRLYYPSVVNSERFHEINYAVLVYPIDETYQHVPAWDYPYTRFLLENSRVVFNQTWINNNDLVILEITGRPEFKAEDDVFQRGRRSLNLV